jgi:uncharacterized protein (UPF0332 family)
MTLSETERIELINHRKEKANNLYKEAIFLFDSGLFNTAVNRICYGMYHMVSALALKDNFTTSKHLQLIGWFNHKYVKENIVDNSTEKYLMRAFEMRSKSDYDDFVKYAEPEVKALLANMKYFVDCIEKLLP